MKLKKITLIVFFLSFQFVYAQVPANIPSNNLIAYWNFSGNANDISGKNHHAVVSNATLTTDRFGNPNSAYELNGNNSRISVSDAFFDVGWNAFTISCWTNSYSLENPNNVNDSQIVFNTSLHNGVALTMYNSNQPFDPTWNNKYVFLAGSNPSVRDWDVVLDKSNLSRTINTWNHLVLVKNGLQYSLYINGVLDKTFTGKKAVGSSLTKMIFGNISPEIPENEGFNGKLDDFAIWDRALTQSEISALGNNNTKTDLSLKSKSLKQRVEKDSTGQISFTLKNQSSTTATNIKVLLKIPYSPPFVIKNSQNCTKGTFDSNMWMVPELAAGDSCVLNMIYQPTQSGVWYVEAEVFSSDQEDTDSKVNNGIETEDDFTRSCLSIPIKISIEPFGMQLFLEDPKITAVQWFKNDVILIGENKNRLQVTSLGRYGYTSTVYKCPDQGCCPFILEKSETQPNCCQPLEYIVERKN